MNQWVLQLQWFFMMLRLIQDETFPTIYNMHGIGCISVKRLVKNIFVTNANGIGHYLTLTLLSLFGEIARIGQTCSIQRVKEIFY